MSVNEVEMKKRSAAFLSQTGKERMLALAVALMVLVNAITTCGPGKRTKLLMRNK
uniref:CNNM transmembrane domain-containing protein n=1 Tax=Ascaris lumbricoides TaxID=6252 RepID=A0A0M3HG67_ASCLU